jgi:hypothetical protein
LQQKLVVFKTGAICQLNPHWLEASQLLLATLCYGGVLADPAKTHKNTTWKRFGAQINKAKVTEVQLLSAGLAPISKRSKCSCPTCFRLGRARCSSRACGEGLARMQTNRRLSNRIAITFVLVFPAFPACYTMWRLRAVAFCTHLRAVSRKTDRALLR